MVRLFLLNAILFLLPFLIYAGWLYATRGSASGAAAWSLKTVVSLAAVGALIMVIGLLVFIHFNGAPPGAVYEPARIDEQGRIVPGQLR